MLLSISTIIIVTDGRLDAQEMDQGIQVELADHSCDESAICDEKWTNQNTQEMDQSKYARNGPIITGQSEYKKGQRWLWRQTWIQVEKRVLTG